jgi:Family of unknown function (DUF6384)
MNTATPAVLTRTDTTPLDEVMLAMDIVDTLRHDRSTVDRELDAETRDEVLIERIKQIYAGQGIEVTDDLIRKGVEALKQDRFAYVPPKPSFALRMAQVYVDRWKWFKRTAITSALVSGGWVAYQLPQQWQDSRAYAAYENRVEELGTRVDRFDQRLARVKHWHDVQKAADEPVRAAIARLVDEVDSTLKFTIAQRADLAAIAAVDADRFAKQAQETESAISHDLAVLGGMEAALNLTEQKSSAADRLNALAARFRSAATVLADAALKPADQAIVNGVRQQAEAALRAGDALLAEASMQRLDQIAAQLSQVYELRIVSQAGVKSGVWRYPVDNPKGRNYYLVVEAISESGLVLSLPIRNEETQKIEQVNRYAVRVPESVYESVKADKRDNGLIDDGLVGTKRRGELEVDFKMPINGGYITEWDD